MMKRALLALGIFLFVISRSVWAICTLDTTHVESAPMPLQLGAITAGADLADGTVLYKQTYNLDFTSGNQAITVTCTGNGNPSGHYTYSSTPLPLSSWSSGIESGKVYETGVPGIGVWVHQGTTGDAALPVSKLLSNSGDVHCSLTGGNNQCIVFGGFKRWDVYLIKTGPIQPGTIVGSNLPCIRVNYNVSGSLSEGLVEENVCMSGTINVVASSCKTPDVTVPMGSYDVSSFSGKGSATKWVNASIKLTDCPVYYGHGSSGSWYVDASGTNNSGTPTKNALTVRLTPATAVINSSQGIFGLTPTTDSAGGAGIQLAYGSSASPELVDLNATKTYEMDIGSTGISEIPLVARYIQTDTKVTPGVANSAVTFLINYY
ncbi:fimbrial protein [Klebsiella aerogenes]|uniref:fimbrial protein n=1 Tax=Klebsiella aerogenes TaxID=548 RepID=UPI002EC7D64A|nr:fimbrial protein [Klebsiella aerogenes]